MRATGSPPHTWGTLAKLPGARASHRFTPTYVGNTGAAPLFLFPVAVHPHIRGEHCRQTLTWAAVSGSPPHTWGTHQFVDERTPVTRFSPTYVGNTPPCAVLLAGPSVHPHIRGEHVMVRTHTEPLPGSPPHTWGTHPRDAGDAWPCRFTPTYVGNTWSASSSGAHSAVHPHIRGEHGRSGFSANWPHGSPPHTWGTPSRARPSGPGLRFTPTYVGNTESR